MEIRVSSNAVEVAQDLAKLVTGMERNVDQAMAEQAQVFRGKVQARASGRPGPRAQTGDYRRSINAQFAGRRGGAVRWEVGTNSVQGRRLEFGFWGLIDAIGRLFHQPPYPHFEPAADEMEQTFPVAIERAVGSALGGNR